MRSLLLALLFVATGCVARGHDYAVEEGNRKAHEDCLFYGFAPGSESFAYCMMKRGAVRPNAGFR